MVRMVVLTKALYGIEAAPACEATLAKLRHTIANTISTHTKFTAAPMVLPLPHMALTSIPRWKPSPDEPPCSEGWEQSTPRSKSGWLSSRASIKRHTTLAPWMGMANSEVPRQHHRLVMPIANCGNACRNRRDQWDF